MPPMFVANSQNTAEDLIKTLVGEYMQDWPDLQSMKYFDRTYTFSTVFDIINPTLDLNFGAFGWEKSRWDKFCKQYLDEGFLQWLQRLPTCPKSAETGYSFKDAKHAHGNCVAHISFHPEPEPQITMYSRISNLVPTSILELSLANLVAVSLFDVFHQSVRIRWMAAQIQFSPLWGFYYLHKNWTAHEKRAWMDSKTGKEYWKLVGRFERFCTGEFIPPYGREKNLYERARKEYPRWTPTYFLIDEEKYHFDVSTLLGIPADQEEPAEIDLTEEDDDESS